MKESNFKIITKEVDCGETLQEALKRITSEDYNEKVEKAAKDYVRYCLARLKDDDEKQNCEPDYHFYRTASVDIPFPEEEKKSPKLLFKINATVEVELEK